IWTGGMIQGPGPMSIAASGALTIIAGSTSLVRNFTIDGTLNWSGGTLTVSPSLMTNNGTINLSGVATLVTTGPATLLNNGTISRTGGGTTTFFPSQMTLNNVGTVAVFGGELALDSRYVAHIA